MNKLPFKVLNIANLSITKMQNEIIVIYRGKRHFFIKKFYTDKLKKMFVAFSIFVLVLSFFIIDPFSSDEIIETNLQKETNEENIAGLDSNDNDENFNESNNVGSEASDIEMEKDEKQKNALLLSSTTDYSEDDKSKALEIFVYKVKPGDTLSEIAKNYGVSMDTICGSNNLTSYDFIHQGKILKIPNKDGILCKVKKGEKLLSIAKKYKIDPEKIISQNNIANSDFLSVNGFLFLPDAKPQNIFPGYLWPAASRHITSAYGWRFHPTLRVRRFHSGIDIRSKYQLVRSTKFGKVTFAGWLGGYGKAVIIAHPSGVKSLYGHLSKFIVKKGQYVKQGQYIARSGNTGRSSGPHLHFEIIKNGRHVNPRKFVK